MIQHKKYIQEQQQTEGYINKEYLNHVKNKYFLWYLEEIFQLVQ